MRKEERKDKKKINKVERNYSINSAGWETVWIIKHTRIQTINKLKFLRIKTSISHCQSKDPYGDSAISTVSLINMAVTWELLLVLTVDVFWGFCGNFYLYFI